MLYSNYTCDEISNLEYSDEEVINTFEANVNLLEEDLDFK